MAQWFRYSRTIPRARVQTRCGLSSGLKRDAFSFPPHILTSLLVPKWMTEDAPDSRQQWKTFNRRGSCNRQRSTPQRSLDTGLKWQPFWWCNRKRSTTCELGDRHVKRKKRKEKKRQSNRRLPEEGVEPKAKKTLLGKALLLLCVYA